MRPYIRFFFVILLGIYGPIAPAQSSQPYNKLLDNSYFFYDIFSQIGMWSGSVIPNGDTTINSLQYTSYSDTLLSKTYFIREDSAQRKVWTFIPNYPTEVVLYDFSLSVGSLITLQRSATYTPVFQVSTVDSVHTLAGYRKRIILNNMAFFNDQLIWIEGVGSTGHPVYLPIIQSDPAYSLSCVYQNSIQTYDSGWGSCPSWQTITSINQSSILENAPPLHVYPNPAYSELHIELDHTINNRINIYTTTGQLIRTYPEIKINLYTLNIATYSKGTYILEVVNNKEQRRQLFIKD